MNNRLPSPIAAVLATLIKALLYPLLIVIGYAWRRHERDVLTAAALPYRCDGGEPEKYDVWMWIDGRETTLQKRKGKE
jgi:hypothetical protein